ncbi:galactose-binding domain-containing protein [Pareuzebyella sediminis]|uniref:galactose-binding domain-containing protein n=1 Tax=Pareuzebyella sediminis TaxID=2607998 RepID=UPI0011F07A46|nr:discoidin domain-containing protein [Pareuzebyella sediminis]
MKFFLPSSKFRKYLFLSLSLTLLGAVPYFAGSGLDNPEPLNSYLNYNFPARLSGGLPYVPVFPNLTFDSPLTFNEVSNTNKVIVGQRDGQIFWFDKVPDVTQKNLLLDLSDKVGVVWDGGFLGMALHPEYGTAGHNYFYVFYTTEDANSTDYPDYYTTQSCNNEEYWGNFLVLSRYEMDPTTFNVQESSEQILLKLRMYGTTHRGGGLLFGDDGFLYLTTGDQTAFKKAQDITNNLDGGVLRLDVAQDPTKSHAPVRTMPADHGFSDEITGNGYWIPNDNPFLSPTGDNFEEYYSLGHRNPHRMTKDRATGDLYVGEIGGGRHEEINVVKKGKNYGWPLYEGLYMSTFCVPNLLNNMPHEEPLTYFPRSAANSIIGGYVYRGSEIPELQGKYVCADYGVGEEIWTIDIATGDYTQLGSFSSTDIISFGEDADAELYIMKLGVSTLYKMVSKDNPYLTVPQLLSETGAFTDLNTLEPSDGLIPYDLIDPFWSDGALKKRWVGIPNDGTHDTPGEKIGYSEEDVWNFPIGSVLVKHFELPIDENNPSITKKIETRFSIKGDDGNFYYVTYKWNDQQTDAQLLTTGLDETINIALADGSTSTQTWQYPSTSDCISCHNATSGGTLGTRTRYLNKDYTYPKTGRTANQLVTLSHLGILDQSITDSDTNNLLTYKSIDDQTATIDDKARSYLDLNCAYCHRPGTGNRGEFDLRMKLDIAQTGLLTASPIETLGIPNEKIVEPGNINTSILYHRINSTDPAVRMPPLAKNKIDDKAVQLIEDWINQMTDPCPDRIIMETYSNVSGTTIADLKSDTNFPDHPSQTDELYEFNIPINVADNYGVRVRGILTAPETGTYYFWISGDDAVELNLSSDTSEANKIRIAYHNLWSNFSEWNKYPTQKSAGINLVAGQNYYIEALMNEGYGGDNLSVGWRRPSEGDGTIPSEIIPCTVFDFFNGPPIVNVTGVVLSPDTATVTEGLTEQLTATISPVDATDTGVTWSSDDESVATVDASGLVTGVSPGTATITATTDDGGFTSTSLVAVSPAPIPVSGVVLSPDTATVTEGLTEQLTATISPVDATDTGVTWSSDDESVATVDASGLVTGVSPGVVTIRVTTNDGNFISTSIITVESSCILSNAALGGTASQSSTYGNGVASLAIDGYTSGTSPWSADLQHTQSEVTPWWEVDLGAEYILENLKIFNRNDSFSTRLNNFHVFVSITPISSQATISDLESDPDVSDFYFSGQAGLEETIALNTQGRYVRVQLSGNGMLHMAEVEVMGCFLQASPCDGSDTVAISPVGPFLDTDPVQALTGSPSGGVWSGASTDGTFDPGLGAGTYTVTYTYDDGSGCVQSDSYDIEVATVGSGGCVLSNVALGGTSSMSSTYGNSSASYAVDGSTTGTSPWSADLQHTQNEYRPWWEVDLGADHTVDQVVLYNRSDGNQSRLRDFYVLVSAAPFPAGATLEELLEDGNVTGAYFPGPAGASETVPLNAEGRYVRVQLSGNGMLHMAEVEVMGCFLQASPCDGSDTVAISPVGPFLDTDPVQALTGSPSGGVWSGASTDGTFDPGLGAGTYTVTYTYDDGSGCVQSDSYDIEVATVGSGGCVLSNVALGGTSSMSSTYGNSSASYAVDGSTTGTSPWSADLQHTQNEYRPWWEVDLGADHTVDQVVLYNRSDGNQSRLRDFYVLVSAAPFPAGATLEELLEDGNVTGAYFPGPAGASETVPLNAEGRYVRVQLSGNGILHMAEVEVMGCPVDIGAATSTLKIKDTDSNVLSPSENIFAISLVPNPANDIVYLETVGDGVISKLSIFDINGKLMLTKKMDNSSLVLTALSIDISWLTKGVYQIHIILQDGTVYTQSLIKN